MMTILLAAVTVWAATVGQGDAQSRTIAGANEDLQTVSNRGTTKVEIYLVESLETDGCSVTIKAYWLNLGARHEPRYTLNWGGISEIRYPYIEDFTVRVAGRHLKYSGDSTFEAGRSLTLEYESRGAAARAAAAMEFLRNACADQ
jgi:hypothetical protein